MATPIRTRSRGMSSGRTPMRSPLPPSSRPPSSLTRKTSKAPPPPELSLGEPRSEEEGEGIQGA
jgi:hypothetical protein